MLFRNKIPHLVISLYLLIFTKYRCKPSRTGMLLRPSQPMAEFFLLLFFFPHKSFSSKSEVLCLIIDVRKNKHGTKLRTLIWKHGVSRFYHYSIKVELRKKETIEFAKQRSWTFFLKQIGGSWWRESCLKEEKGREERVEKIFRIGEKVLGFRFFFFFLLKFLG